MNEKKFILELYNVLKDFIVYDDLLPEIVKLLKKSGCEKAFLALLFTRLRFLSKEGVLATRHQEYELLGDGVYSMHVVVRTLNIRILYMFFPGQAPVLLHAFFEREGHNNTDYSGKIRLAQDRFQELKEEL